MYILLCGYQASPTLDVQLAYPTFIVPASPRHAHVFLGLFLSAYPSILLPCNTLHLDFFD
jgi:hypothetical protein